MEREKGRGRRGGVRREEMKTLLLSTFYCAGPIYKPLWLIINQCPEKRGERDTSKISVGQGNNKARKGGGRGKRGGVEREGERDGTWYITVNLPGINLSHKRI